MNKPLVIGVGNRYRGDDVVGLEVAKAIASRINGKVDVIYCEGDPMALLDLWVGREKVFIIDAVTSGSEEIGFLHRYDMSRESIPAIFTNTSTHFLDVIQVVELARALGKLPQQIMLYGIEAKDFPMEERLSEKMSSFLPQIFNEILNDLSSNRKLN